jgi:hypothetical protein
VTVVVGTIWGGRVSVLVDRRISRRLPNGLSEIIDDNSNKILIVQCYGSLFAIAYTGVAVAHESWMDCVIAELLAHQRLPLALVRPGAPLLARPAYALIEELKVNLNGALNSDHRSRSDALELLIQGWQYRKGRLIPFSCKLFRGPRHRDGNRYFELDYRPVAKFFRENPRGLWGESLGDDGGAITRAFETLRSTTGFTHDNVEQHLRQAILDRSSETGTVSPACVALQLDPRIPEGQAIFTYYPHERCTWGYPLLSPWVMTPGMICSPSTSTSAYSRRSECGNYLLGGFSDENTNLHVITRLSAEYGMSSGAGAIEIGFQRRPAAQ